MLPIFGQSLPSQGTLKQVSDIFEGVVNSYFSLKSMIALAVAIILAVIVGRLLAAALRYTVSYIGRYADKSPSLQTVNKLRRLETSLIITIALLRTGIMLFALYLWWIYIHPNGAPTGIIGASALAAIMLGATIAPLLRDISAGSIMMAEQWYAVGDHVKLEPFGEMQGVVERVTLRSTRLRHLNGEITWVNNQNIQAVRVFPKGVVTMAIELFVTDINKGHELVDSVNRRLPMGKLLVISPLNVMTSSKVGDKLWHITALGETAPGREWLLEKYALEVFKEIDEDRKLKLLATDPIARYADSEAERRFARSIKNSTKEYTGRKAKSVAKRLETLVEELTVIEDNAEEVWNPQDKKPDYDVDWVEDGKSSSGKSKKK
jgi:hypothetical protein